MKWATQILINDSGICPGIFGTKTKKDARIWAEKWASIGADTRVLRAKGGVNFDPFDDKGWEIITEYKAGRPVAD